MAFFIEFDRPLQGTDEPGEGDIIISDVSNAQYFGEISVGSDRQAFQVSGWKIICSI